MNINEKFYCSRCMRELEDDMVCPHCGYDPTSPINPSELEEGTPLGGGRYLVGAVIGRGGFGITYAGWDLTLNKPIAIKEFYPQNRVSRNTEESLWVTPEGTEESQLVYHNGVEWFQHEARILAALGDTHNVVHVEDFFQANGTAYIIMDFIRGEMLAAYLTKKGSKIPETETMDLLKKPLEALNKVHQFGLLHGDISPSNLMMDDNGEVHLIDFGASTSVKDDSEFKVQELFMNRKFSPPEQLKNQELGFWSDVYAFCATCIYLMTGKTIPSAAEREADDPIPGILRTLKLPYRQKRALRHGLMLNPKRRTENTARLLYELYKVPLPKSKEALQRQKKITYSVVASVFLLYVVMVLFLGFNIIETSCVGASFLAIYVATVLFAGFDLDEARWHITEICFQVTDFLKTKRFWLLLLWGTMIAVFSCLFIVTVGLAWGDFTRFSRFDSPRNLEYNSMCWLEMCLASVEVQILVPCIVRWFQLLCSRTTKRMEIIRKKWLKRFAILTICVAVLTLLAAWRGSIYFPLMREQQDWAWMEANRYYPFVIADLFMIGAWIRWVKQGIAEYLYRIMKRAGKNR